MSEYPFFDGHNDTLLKLEIGDPTRKSDVFFTDDSPNHIDFGKAKAAGLKGGFFAMWVPSTLEKTDFSKFDPTDAVNFAEIEQEAALRYTNRMLARAYRLCRASNEKVVIVKTVDDIRKATANNQLSILLHIEGAEAIDEDLNALEVLYQAGLRSIGLVWSRKNIFADGVPMGFPGSPDTGKGLTSAGRALVQACNEKGIMLDLSHLNEKGFWDVANLSDAPLVATHSNVHKICPSPRNLTDAQLDAIAQSKGCVGLNFHVGFLRKDGKRDSDTKLDVMVEHLSYLVEKLGEEGVALGSDFDGALMPNEIKDVTGLPNLAKAMEKAQFGEKLIKKICYENWLSVLERTFKDELLGPK